MSKFYIDGDILAYQAIWNSEKEADVRSKINKSMKSIIESVNSIIHSTDGKIAIKGNNNFRKEIYADYKGNRKKEMEPLEKELMEASYKHLIEFWGAVEAHGMEADDLIAIWNTEEKGVMCSIDKDMLQVPGLHFNFRKNEFTTITEDQGSYQLHIQMLTGDSTDNIKGLKGIGPVKAKEIMKGVAPADYLTTVRAAWQTHHGRGWEDELQLTTDLVYLKRSDTDQYNTGV